MASIDIGSSAITRGSSWADKTLVDKNNPANASGTITKVEIYTATELIDCEIGIFYVVSGNNLSTRDTEVIGTVTAGSKQTFSVSLNVQTGDYIGIYSASGAIYMDTSGGVGIWYGGDDVDLIPCTDTTFSYIADYIISVYGTSAEEDNSIFLGCNF